MKEKVSKKDLSSTKTKARSLTGKRGKSAPTKFLPGKALSSIFTSSKALPPHSTSLASTTKQIVAPQCEEITIVEPVSTQTSSVWPADGILRQALMSYSYPHQANEKQPETLAESVLEISSDSVEVLELTQEESMPIDSLSDKMGTISCDHQTTAISTYTVSLSTNAPCTQLTPLLLSNPDLHSSQALHNAQPASDLLSTVNDDGETFVSIPVVLMSGDRLVPTTLPGIASGTSDGKFCTLVTDVGRMEPSDASPTIPRPLMTSTPTKGGFVTVVYSTVPDAAAVQTKFHNQKLPLPPMSDLKSKRTNRLVPAASKKAFRPSDITRIIGANNSAVPRIIASGDTASVDFGDPLTVDSFLKSGLQTSNVELISTSNVELISTSHLIPISSVHPLLVSSLQSAVAGSNVTSTVTSIPTLPKITENALRKRKPIKSIQEILDSQSTGTTYTTSYCSPIMAVQNHMPHDNTLHANAIQSSNLFPAPPPSTAPAPVAAVNTNSQLHALLNNTVSNTINSPSLHALLNNTISNSPANSPSLHSLLNTVANPNPNSRSLNSLLDSVPNSTQMPTSSPNAIPFFTSVTSRAPSRTSSAAPAIFVGPDAITYPLLQSQAEILSQLKAGVLPTMSSSQVSSVLSALASDEACRLEMDADASQQELSASNASADKAPSLAHTDDSQLNDSMHDTTDDTTSDKSASKDSAEDTMIVQVMNMISSEERQNSANVLPSTNLLGVGSKHVGVKREAARSNAPPMIFVKQEMLEAANQRGGFGRAGVPMSFAAADGKGVGKATAGVPKAPARPPLAEYEPLEAASNFVERVSCYKCKFCPFLSLEKGEVSTHQQHHHSTQLSDNVGPERRAKLKCPGCSNVFYSPTSLRVHLSQDHQVVGEGLNMMVSVVVDNSASLLRISKHKKTKRRDSAACDTRLAVDPSAPDATAVGSSTIRLQGDELVLVDEAIDGRGMPGDGQALSGDGRGLSCDSGVKIRVRNLDRESDLEHALHNDMVVCADVEVVGAFHDDGDLPMVDEDDEDLCSNGATGLDDEDLCSNGAAGLDDGDLDRVLEEDLMAKQLKATIDPCEYKDVKSDLSSLVVCVSTAPPPSADYNPPPPPPPPPAKRRGRPKGSRNQSRQLLLAMYLPTVSGAVEVMPEKDSAYKCDIDGCAVRLKSHDNIEYHRRCHSGDSYVCPECSLETTHWSPLLLNHLWRVHSIDMELYSCAHCNYKCSSYCKLINVHQLIHGDARPFLCDTCGKGFKNPKQMRNHKVIHSLKRFKGPANGGATTITATALGDCATCGRSFNTARLLRLHQDNVHRKLRPHLCNFCGYSASSRSTLKMHMRQHTGEKPFGCDECDYRTADHNSLRRHKMRHTGDKPYKCPHCSYACIQSSTFKAHLKSKHPGQDNGLMFSCPHCPFRSVKRDNLVAHMAEHEGGATTTARPRSKEQHRSKEHQHRSSKEQQQRTKAEQQHGSKAQQQQRAKEAKQLAKEQQQQQQRLAAEERQCAKAATTQQQQQNKKERQKKATAQKSSQGISVVDINDIIVAETPQPGVVTDMGVAGSLHLIYVNAETVGEFVKSREQSLMAAGGGSLGVDSGAADVAEMPPPASTIEASSAAGQREGGHRVADFEPEEITGDIRDIVTIPEPGELKFKVAPEQL